VLVSTWLAFATERSSVRADANAAEAEQRRNEAEVATRAAEKEKREAETARAEAENRRKEAQIQHDRAEAALNRSEWRLYASQIAAAQRDSESNDTSGAWYYLNSCRWDFRGWEHRYLYTSSPRIRPLYAGTLSQSRAWRSVRTGNGSSSEAMTGRSRVWDATLGQETVTLKGHTG
jgi:hypothetical protein